MRKEVTITVSKRIEELQGMEDVLFEPRSWKPEDLKQVCMNIDFQAGDAEIDNLVRATVVFLVRDFFYLVHQNGLYNLQKEMWSTIARTKKIEIKTIKNPFWVKKDNYAITDIYLKDSSTDKFVKARILHPGAQEEIPRMDDLMSNVHGRCTGVIYLSPDAFPEKLLEKVRKKTNNVDNIDKYKSPLGKIASFNLLNYTADEAKYEYGYRLIHPNLGREVSTKVCLHQ